MSKRFAAIMTALSVASVWTSAAHAGNRPQASWLTDGGDSKRTSWQRNETRIDPKSAKGMKLLWTLQLDNAPRQMHSLLTTLIASGVETPQGPREIAVVAGVSDNL